MKYRLSVDSILNFKIYTHLLLLLFRSKKKKKKKPAPMVTIFTFKRFSNAINKIELGSILNEK